MQMQSVIKEASHNDSVFLQVWPALMRMYARHGDQLARQYGGSGSMHKIRMRSEKAYHEDVMSALVRLDDAEHAGPRSSDVESSTLERRGTGEKATLGGGMKNMFTAIKRYYNNTFTDQDKQFAMHLALGVYEPYLGYEEMPSGMLEMMHFMRNRASKMQWCILSRMHPWHITGLAMLRIVRCTLRGTITLTHQTGVKRLFLSMQSSRKRPLRH